MDEVPPDLRAIVSTLDLSRLPEEISRLESVRLRSQKELDEFLELHKEPVAEAEAFRVRREKTIKDSRDTLDIVFRRLNEHRIPAEVLEQIQELRAEMGLIQDKCLYVDIVRKASTELELLDRGLELGNLHDSACRISMLALAMGEAKKLKQSQYDISGLREIFKKRMSLLRQLCLDELVRILRHPNKISVDDDASKLF